ncbi:MAG: LysR family transcriptional regulator [Rhodoferax sp.]|nr:LysR family transcriptional regulator [Rhodoferax sp.]MCP5263683.1 LysR family transcriptional regulator [Rhodoferax sp.]MCW5630232.1 LysR family transcriptional regulator [Rhodoferax sp.]
MELEQLKYFIQVAEHGSFSRAAAALAVTQPFLSRQVRRLEVELHRHLFYRHGRGIWLTEDGERFLRTARSVTHQLELATVVSSGAAHELTGRFAFGLTPTLSRTVTVPLVRAFTARFPLARLSIVEDLSRKLHERVLSGQLDAALLHDQAASTQIEVEPVCRLDLHLLTRQGGAMAQRDRVDFAELAGLPMIFPSPPNPLRSLVESQAVSAGVELHVVYDVDGVETILDLVREGYGHTVTSAHVVGGDRRADSLLAIPIASPALVTTLSLARASRHRPSTLHRMALDVLRHVLKRVLAPA